MGISGDLTTSKKVTGFFSFQEIAGTVFNPLRPSPKAGYFLGRNVALGWHWGDLSIPIEFKVSSCC